MAAVAFLIALDDDDGALVADWNFLKKNIA
jgi:hypothetical protein